MGISSREELVLCFHRLRLRLFILLLSTAQRLLSVYVRRMLLFTEKAQEVVQLTVTPVVLFIQGGHTSHFCSGSVCVCADAWRAVHLELQRVDSLVGGEVKLRVISGH